MLSRLRKKVQTPNTVVAAVLIGVFICITGCGVKGDPVPPDHPPELGRGQPTYRKATEKIQLQKYTPADDEEDKESDDE